MNNDNLEKDLSGCEKMVMKIVWDASEDISTPEIIEAMRTRYGKNYARTTVSTLVQRLVNKEFVETYRKGRTSYVHPIRDERKYTENFIQSVTDFWVNGEPAFMLSTLSEKQKFSAEEIQKIKNLVCTLENELKNEQ